MTLAELDLSAKANAAAATLKAIHPEVVFTSGRRDLAAQARAMASNVIHNRDWIAQTYTATPQRDALQTCVDGCAAGADQGAFAAALLAAMSDWSDPDLAHVSKHLSGDAFDVQPVPGPAGEAIKATIRSLYGLTKFLEVEGGLIRWHAQFA
jgi:hypothetical protein